METTYALLGDIFGEATHPENGCCPSGPSYACYRCGVEFCERTDEAQEATGHFVLKYWNEDR